MALADSRGFRYSRDQHSAKLSALGTILGPDQKLLTGPFPARSLLSALTANFRTFVSFYK